MLRRASKRTVQSLCQKHVPRQIEPYIRSTRYTYLFIDGVSVAKNNVAAEQTCKERIMGSLLSAVEFLLEEQKRLVERDKFGEVQCMMFRSAKNDPQTSLPAGVPSDQYLPQLLPKAK